ncbi:MAG: toprim domain-containing protein, partial [Hyphomicrobiaceae bacterium]
AVAPLGTALTAEQMRLMWRITPEPILCFDGDAAGQKAAHRAIDTAIPLLVPGYSLRFTFLSGGLDPDDLIRQQGPSAMRAALNSARPLADVLWDREWNSGSWTTPERRARLEAKLRSIVTQIGDSAVRAHYGQILKERLTQAWGPERGFSAKSSRRFENRRGNTFARGSASGVTGHGRFQAERTSSLKQSALVGGAGQALPYREALLIRTLLNHPWLIDEFAEDISELQLSSPVLTRLRDGLLTLLANEISLDSATIHTQLEGLKLRQDLGLVEFLATHNSDRFVGREAERAEVETGWRHILALHKRQTLQDQLSVAGREYRNDDSDDAMARIVELQRLIASPGDHETQYED